MQSRTVIRHRDTIGTPHNWRHDWRASNIPPTTSETDWGWDTFPDTYRISGHGSLSATVNHIRSIAPRWIGRKSHIMMGPNITYKVWDSVLVSAVFHGETDYYEHRERTIENPRTYKWDGVSKVEIYAYYSGVMVDIAGTSLEMVDAYEDVSADYITGLLVSAEDAHTLSDIELGCLQHHLQRTAMCVSNLPWDDDRSTQERRLSYYHQQCEQLLESRGQL